MSRPRPCAGCGVNPVAYAGREFCYDCVPRTWKKPPRCKLCGSAEDYYTNGRCRRLCDPFGLTVGGAERYTRPVETGW
jgi:hypothetical protein